MKPIRKKLLGTLIFLSFALAACFPATKTPTTQNGNRLLFNVSDGRFVTEPVWSPNGLELAFTAFDPWSGDNEIYIVNVSTSQIRSLLRLNDIRAQAWSPDGGKIVYRHGRDIWAFPADGGTAPEILASGQVAAWSPDGKQMAIFQNAGTNDPGTYLLKIVDMETGITKTIYSTNLGKQDIFDLAWSPTEMSLAFSRGPETPESGIQERDIYILNLNDEELSQLTFGDESSFPTWSPDGKRLAYLHKTAPSGSASIIISQLDGSCKIEVPGISDVGSLAWSPDGSYLAYSINSGIYLLDLATIFGEDFLTTGPTCSLTTQVAPSP